MAFLRRSYHAPGTAPGTYDVDRTREAETSAIRVVEYSPAGMSVSEGVGAIRRAAGEGVQWLRISGHPSLDVLEQMREQFDVDPLVLEDIVTAGQRPKFNEFESGLFMTMAVPEPEGTFQQLSLYLSGNTLISHILNEGDLFLPIEARIESERSRLRNAGADYLLYALLDLAIDHFFPVLDNVGARIAALEDEVLDGSSSDLLGEIHEMRSWLLVLRKVTWATRELISDLLRHLEGDQLSPVRVYLQDVYDHTVSAIDLVETYRDMAASLVETHLSVMNNRMNDVIRVLTIIATVFIPPTFVVGVYGMNFDRTAGAMSMPELGWPYGYLAVMGISALMMIGMLIYFRVKRWF